MTRKVFISELFFYEQGLFFFRLLFILENLLYSSLANEGSKAFSMYFMIFCLGKLDLVFLRIQDYFRKTPVKSG